MKRLLYMRVFDAAEGVSGLAPWRSRLLFARSVSSVSSYGK